jgi:hypothetical protein
MSENYEAVNLAEIFEEAERFDSQSEGNEDYLANFVRMPDKEGYVTVRLLPPVKGKRFYCATRTHRLGKKNLHCPRELVSIQGKKRWVDNNPKDPCPICKFYNGLWRESEDAEADEAKVLQDDARKIKPIERYYYNCIVRHQVNKKGEVEKNVGPKILSIGKTLHERIVRAITGDAKNDEKGLGDVSDLKIGRDFKIVKKLRGQGKEQYPYYEESKFQDPSPLADKDQIDIWLGQMHDLNALRVLKDSGELDILLQKYNGVIPDDDAETSFDMSKYRKKPETLEEQVEQAKAESKPRLAPVPEVKDTAKSADTVLEAEDFFDELRAVKGK